MMGHEEQQQVISGALRRMMLVVAVAALMALMMAASAMPAFAQSGSSNCANGQFNAIGQGNKGIDNQIKHLIKGLNCL